MSPDSLDLPITYVERPEQLAEAWPLWEDAGLLAVDIECSLTGIHHCVLALIQVATHERTWIIDPLPLGDDLKPWLQKMATMPWIAHDWSGDGIVFKRLYDVEPVSVLDTMLLARTLGYPQPGLKTMAKLKLGIDIPKEEQDSNWMLRPLRETQLSYAARDAALLLPLLRVLSREAEARRAEDSDLDQRLKQLPKEMAALRRRIRRYEGPGDDPIVDKARKQLGDLAAERARELCRLRRQWGNEGDVAAVMELGNRWMLARLEHPPASLEALERTIPNPRFRRKRAAALWELFRGEAEHQAQTQDSPEASDGVLWSNA
jgi:ribonuclease D